MRRKPFAGLGAADRTLRVYPGQYHELLHETEAERAKVIADLLAWLVARTMKSGG